jgi:putative PIN family toxin of toxin-antitoxin system
MNPQSPWGELLGRQAEFTHVTSPEILREFLRVLNRPRIHRWIDPTGSSSHIAQALEIVRRAEVVAPGAIAPVSRDAGDDELFACAIAGAADFIVSEDADVLIIGSYEGVRTVRAAEFLRLLDAARQ